MCRTYFPFKVLSFLYSLKKSNVMCFMRKNVQKKRNTKKRGNSTFDVINNIKSHEGNQSTKNR